MTSILSAILDVFSSVGTWIAEAVTDLIPMFYGEGGLTFLGVLAVSGLAFSVVFLIIGLNSMGPLCSDTELKTALTAGTAL